MNCMCKHEVKLKYKKMNACGDEAVDEVGLVIFLFS